MSIWELDFRAVGEIPALTFLCGRRGTRESPCGTLQPESPAVTGAWLGMMHRDRGSSRGMPLWLKNWALSKDLAHPGALSKAMKLWMCKCYQCGCSNYRASNTAAQQSVVELRQSKNQQGAVSSPARDFRAAGNGADTSGGGERYSPAPPWADKEATAVKRGTSSVLGFGSKCGAKGILEKKKKKGYKQLKLP